MGFLQNADDISFDENGNAIASSITPTYGNQLAKAVGTAQGGKLGENLKAMIISGAEVKNAGENVTSVTSDHATINKGKKETFDNDVTTLNNSDPLAYLAKTRFGGDLQKAADWTKTAEGVKWATDPRNEASIIAAEAAHQISSRTGTDAEDTALAATGVTLGGASLMAINSLTKEPLMDKEGNYVLDKHGKRVESGVIGRGLDKGWDKLRSATDKLRGISDEATNNTTDSSNNHKTNKNDNGTNNDRGTFNDGDKSSIHNKSFNSDKENISNKNESVKDQIGNQFKKEQTLNNDADFKRDMSKLQERQASEKALNPDNPHVAERHANEKTAMEDAHHQRITESNLATDTAKPKSWMNKIQDAMSGSGSFRTKLSVTAGAMALGYGVDAEAREMSPSSVSTASRLCESTKWISYNAEYDCSDTILCRLATTSYASTSINGE